MTQLPLTSLWSTLFFATLVFLGLDSEFAVVEGITAICMDAFPGVLYKPRNRTVFLAAFCCVSYLLGLTMVTKGGIHVFRIVDHYAVNGIVLLITVFFEAFVVGWIFGADKFADALELMFGYRVGLWMKLSWWIFTPLATLGIMLFQVATFKPLQYREGLSFPLWTTIVGTVLILSSTICIPVVLVYRLLVANGSIKQRWADIITPRLRSHQIHPKWRHTNFMWNNTDCNQHHVTLMDTL